MNVSTAEQSNVVSTERTQSQTRQTLLTWLGLFILGIISRLPFRGEILYHWDSINFAYAIQEFDVAKGQPHVPGYILYVYLTRLVDFMFQDAQLTLTTISIVSSGLAVAWLYLLGKEMFNQTIGLIAALFLASSPLFWFYGEIALPHSLDTFAVILSAWFLYRLMDGQLQLAIPTAICLGIAGGFRPQTQVFLAPLILFVGLRLCWQRDIKTITTLIIAIVVLGVVDLVWFVPLLWLNGGPTEYFEIMGNFSDRFQTTTSVFKGAGLFGLTRNVTKLTLYTLYGWGLAIIPAGMAVGWLAYKRDVPYLFRDKRFWFAFFWVMPSFLYYLLIHMGQQGLVFVYLPMLLLLSAVGLNYIASSIEIPYVGQMVAIGAIVGNSLIFLALPAFPLGQTGPKLLNVDTLNQHDAYFLSRFEMIQEQFPPSQTLILATSWRFPQFYLPNYHWQPYKLISKRELGAGEPSVSEETVITPSELGLTSDAERYYYLIIFDNDILPFNRANDRLQFVSLSNGEQLAYIRFQEGEALYISPEFYDIVEVEQ